MTSLQKKLLYGALAAYLIAYTGRLNLSAALPAMARGLQLSGAQAGMFQTVFAVVYATGQLVNGMIVDRVSPRAYMVVGLIGSAGCNLGMALAGGYGALVGLWAANGAFQSMMWTPIMRLIARDFAGANLRKACSVMAFAPIVGNLLAWAMTGMAVSRWNWNWAFALPAVLMVLAGGLALGLLPGGTGPAARREAGQLGAGALLWRTGFAGVLVCCVAAGFVRDGVIVWTPTIMLRQAGRFPPSLVQLLVPAINLVSIALGALLMRKYGGRPRGMIALMLMGAAAVCGLLTGFHFAGAVILSVMLGLTCMLMYAINTNLVSMVPMQYASVGRVGLTAGLIDSFIYLGSGLAGAAGGALRDALGEQALFFAWVLCALLGAAGMLWAHRRLPGQWSQIM